MSLKLLLISVDGTLADSAKSSHGTVRADLAKLIRVLHQRGVRVALWSNRKWTIGGEPLHDHLSSLSGVEVRAHGVSVDGTPSRRRADSVLPILAEYGAKKHETILLGSSDEDMIAGVNNGLLHVRSDWYGQQSDYGFSVASVEELARFCLVFALREHPVFWRIESDQLNVFSAGPFSTMTNPAIAVFGADARDTAKLGAGHPEFWFLLTVSTLYFGGLLQGVNYICTYPGHEVTTANPTADSFDGVMARLAKCFRMGYFHDLVLRHSQAPKSQKTKAANRLFKTQLDSILLNRYPRKNLGPPNKGPLGLKGKTVLVVDDFCTSGKSLEAARTYLSSAGAHVKLFSWLKTVNTAYTEIFPQISVAPYSKNTMPTEPANRSWSYFQGIADSAAPVELAQVFALYNSWDWSKY